MTADTYFRKIGTAIYERAPWGVRRWISARKYHRAHALEAMSKLAEIERQFGALDKAIYREMDDYAVRTFGSRVYLPWLLVYSAVQRRPAYKCIPDNFYGMVVVPKINKFGWISKYKILSRNLMGSDLVEAIGYTDLGRIRSCKGTVLEVDQAVSSFFADRDRVVFKPVSTGRGVGVRVLNEEAFREFASGRFPEGVFQPYYSQHPFFETFCKGLPVTIRLTTVRGNDGNISLRAGFLRVGRADEMHVTAPSSLLVPIDLRTSRFCEWGYLPSWHAVTHHPDSTTTFGGLEIPHFTKCMDLVLEGHRRFPFPQCIGWDVIVDADGEPRCFEWNGGHNGIWPSEATHGPLFSDLGWESLR